MYIGVDQFLRQKIPCLICNQWVSSSMEGFSLPCEGSSFAVEHKFNEWKAVWRSAADVIVELVRSNTGTCFSANMEG